MSAAYWRENSLRCIKEALAELPADADEKEKRKAISKKCPFGPRQYYPYKIWLEEVAKYFSGPKSRRVSQSDLRRIEEYEKATRKRFPVGNP